MISHSSNYGTGPGTLEGQATYLLQRLGCCRGLCRPGLELGDRASTLGEAFFSIGGAGTRRLKQDSWA